MSAGIRPTNLAGKFHKAIRSVNTEIPIDFAVISAFLFESDFSSLLGLHCENFNVVAFSLIDPRARSYILS